MSTATRKGGYYKKGNRYVDANGNQVPWNEVWAIECENERKGWKLHGVDLGDERFVVRYWAQMASSILEAGIPKRTRKEKPTLPRKTVGKMV